MSHDHRVHIVADWRLDQVCTIAACGMLGGIVLLIWKADLLSKFTILTEQFIQPVALGGIALVVLAILRAVSLWSARRINDESHHQHDGPDCCATHDHRHGHEHHFAPWRYAVLLMPFMLSGLMLYYDFQGLRLMYSADFLVQNHGLDPTIADGPDVPEQEGVWQLGFNELSNAAMQRDTSARNAFQGRVVELKGLFMPISETQFTLSRYRITCCPADAVPINIRIISPVSLLNHGLQPGKGVSVKGKVVFRKIIDRDQYLPVILLKDSSGVHAEDIGNDIYDKGS